ncbi:MAG: hypothetical protein WD904_01870 [Dehalococcoidia bacterium]
MPIPPRYESIVKNLAEASDKLEWRALIAKPDYSIFDANFGPASVRITGDLKSTFSATYTLSIANEQGVQIDEFSVDEGEPMSEALAWIHDNARRRALDVDATIDALAAVLEKLNQTKKDVP